MSHSPLTSSPTRLRAALSKRKTTGPYARSSAAADISRMLDPAYAAKSARRVSAPVMPVHAYVDQSGELHDPDFRDFPLSLNSRRRMSDEAERPGSSTAVPSWERAGMGYSGYGYRSGLNTYDSSVRTSLERYTPQGGQYAYVPSAWSSSPASASSDERPLGDRNMGFASTLDAQVDEHGVPRTPSLSGSWLPSSHSRRSTRRRRSSKKLRKTHVDDYVQEDADTSYSPPLPESFAAALAEPLYFPDQAYVEEPKELPKDEDVPSCSYILRKKYLAIQLRIRFGVHNAKRQIKRRLGRAVVE